VRQKFQCSHNLLKLRPGHITHATSNSNGEGYIVEQEQEATEPCKYANRPSSTTDHTNPCPVDAQTYNFHLHDKSPSSKPGVSFRLKLGEGRGVRKIDTMLCTCFDRWMNSWQIRGYHLTWTLLFLFLDLCLSSYSPVPVQAHDVVLLVVGLLMEEVMSIAVVVSWVEVVIVITAH